jgi:lambda repressor-like predicted transcriptional regulator
MITTVDNPSTVWQDAVLPPDRSRGGEDVPLLEEAYRAKDPADLRQRLKNERWSYKPLARHLGVSRSAVGHWVTGRRRIPPAQALKIAEVLKVDPAVLFVREVSTTVTADANDGRQA